MFGFIGFILLLFILFYIHSLSGRVALLEKKLSGSSFKKETYAPVSQTVQAQSQVTPSRTIPEPPKQIEISRTQVKDGEGLHMDITQISGVKWLTIIGVLALIFGLGFFLKYAIDQNWITPVMRVILGISVGVLLAILGELWKEKYKHYASSLSGGGLAIIYFSLYAAFGFYNLISQEIALLLLVITSCIGVALSYRYAAKVLGVLAVFGGYLAPLMVSTGENRQVALFIYITVLNIAVISMLVKKFWVELLYVLLIGTSLNFGLWAAEFSSKDNTLESAVFLIINFVITTLFVTLLYRKHTLGKSPEELKDDELGQYAGIFHAFTSFLFFSSTTALLYDNFISYLSLAHLLAGCIVYMSYTLVDRLEDKRINYMLSFLGSAFISAGIWWYFMGLTRDAYLLFAASLGIVAGSLLKRQEIRFWGVVIAVFATFCILGENYTTNTFLWNTKFLMEVLAACVFLLSAYFYRINGEDADDRRLSEFGKIAASSLIWFAVSCEIILNFKTIDSGNARNLLLSIWWIGYGVILGIISALRHNAILRKASVVLFALAIVKVFTFDVLALELGYRIVSFITLGIILLMTAFYYQKNKDKIMNIWEGNVK